MQYEVSRINSIVAKNNYHPGIVDKIVKIFEEGRKRDISVEEGTREYLSSISA